MNSAVRDLGTYIKNLHFEDDRYKEAIIVEHRSNNPKRDYLFVNKFQAKHVPCDVNMMQTMCKDLAHKVNEGLQGKYSNILIIGFAETATGIAYYTGTEIKNAAYMMCTTRENIPDTVGKELITFEEEHSHATTQKLFSWKDVNLSDINYILFIEDEISTGNTILNFISAFKNQKVINKDVKFGVASICNWQNEQNRLRFKDNQVQTFALITGELNNVNTKMQIDEHDIVHQFEEYSAYKYTETAYGVDIKHSDRFYEARLGGTINTHLNTTQDILNTIKNDTNIQKILCDKDKSIRVIGTEECMSIAIALALDLNEQGYKTLCHSTTRSKIDILNDKDGLTSRHKLQSMYDVNRETYIYNIEDFTDTVIIITDSRKYDIRAVWSLIDKLNTNEVITIKV